MFEIVGQEHWVAYDIGLWCDVGPRGWQSQGFSGCLTVACSSQPANTQTEAVHSQWMQLSGRIQWEKCRLLDQIVRF